MSKFQESYCIPNTVHEIDSNAAKEESVLNEIERCRVLYNKRQVLKRQKALDVKPLYYENMKRRDFVAKYPIYKSYCTHPKTPRKPDSCSHVDKIILDRDILTKSEHISFLARPKANLGRMVKASQEIYQKRFLPNCTTRVESLAHPKSIRVQHNWQDFHNILSVRQATNLRKTLQKPPLEYTTIEKAIIYVHEERRLKKVMKNEAIRKCYQIKKKLVKIERRQMSKIILALYEVMKELLTSDNFVLDDEASNLVKVLQKTITEFCDCGDNNSTSHIGQLIKSVSTNLANQIEKFTSNCGFRNASFEKEIESDARDRCKEIETQEFLLPVTDYISYHSLSTSEDFVDAQEFVGDGYYEGEENE